MPKIAFFDAFLPPVLLPSALFKGCHAFYLEQMAVVSPFFATFAPNFYFTL